MAAAKARMFTNKPDGSKWRPKLSFFCTFLYLLYFLSLLVVRELNGPYTDPSHPYMYDEEDMWMAPGFIHEFYEVSFSFQVYFTFFPFS